MAARDAVRAFPLMPWIKAYISTTVVEKMARAATRPSGGLV